jgi:hypothetical protein
VVPRRADPIPKGQTVILTASVDGLITNLDPTITKLANGSADTTGSHYRVSYDAAGLVGAPRGHVRRDHADQRQHPHHPRHQPDDPDAWLVSPANYLDLPVGTPLLRIAAIAVTASDELLADFQYPPADGPVGRENHAVGRGGVSAVIESVDPGPRRRDATGSGRCRRLLRPAPEPDNVSIVPDPRLQLSDIVRIQDTDRTGADEYARIFAWTLTYEAGSRR